MMSNTTHSSPSEQSTILIVDDSKVNRVMLDRILQQAGFATLEAANGQSAIDTIHASPVDLVLLDVMMPDMSGFDVLRRIRQSHSMSRLPIIMVTSLSESSRVVEALEAGANDYVTKPIDMAVVLARVNTHLSLKRLAEKNEEFLSIASHDIKKPLAVILDITEVMQETIEGDPYLRGACEEMVMLLKKSAMNMQGIIESYLDLRVMEHGQIKLFREMTDLNRLIENVIELNLEYANKKNIRLCTNLTADLPELAIDRARIEQVLQNLVGNAIKYSPAGTQVEVSSRSDQGYIGVEVKDEGPGIPIDELEQVFEKYTQLSNRPTGGESSAGLGLAITRQLVEVHDGMVGVRNNADAGATFWFRLPVA